MDGPALTAPLVSAENRRAYRGFIEACRQGAAAFGLTPHGDSSPYALCFALFGFALVQDREALTQDRDTVVAALVTNLQQARSLSATVPTDKAYRQLLVFSLSALALLSALEDCPLAGLVREQIPDDVEAALSAVGALAGRPQSGNQAMFLAIFLLHARDHLGLATDAALARWVYLHLEAMNRFGFWGSHAGPTHLHFQNGYHQYEILDYLSVDNPHAADAVGAVRRLADRDGHFAPYPGGGGCYDYDAVFVLTPHGRIPDGPTAGLLRHTAATLLAEQRPDGGFCESSYVRPRSPANLARFARHIGRAAGNPALFLERLRYGLALQRPAHDRIVTHWSQTHRRWNESNLWDSWFRMLTLARLEVAFDATAARRWGFLPYPGIGWHPSLLRPDDPGDAIGTFAGANDRRNFEDGVSVRPQTAGVRVP